MKVIGMKLINGTEVPIVIECMSLEVEGRLARDEKFNPDDCRIRMRSSHPSLSFFIIKTERYELEHSAVKPYKWLTKSEADAIMKCAAESDVIDLRKFGNYQICSESRIQSVYIMNDIDEWTDEDKPLLVKVVDDND